MSEARRWVRSPPRSPQPALAVPASIRMEHQHLHHQLDAAIAAGGMSGKRANAVAEVLLIGKYLELRRADE